MTAPSKPRDCDRACGTRIVLARRAFTAGWMALEAEDRPPFSQEATGAYVVVAGQAYRPDELIEDFQVRFEITETAARELVSGYPWHRAHHDEVDPETGGPNRHAPTESTDSKEHIHP